MTVAEFFKKTFSRVLIGNCLGVVAASVALVFATLLLINLYTHHGKEVEVPDICGINETVAKKKLKAAGLKMEVVDTGYVDRAAPYTVLEQSIRPGERVKPGRIVKITVNANGPRLIALPDVADNSSRREAEDRLKVLGFKLGATEYVIGDPDWVLGIKVNGRSVQAGTKVSVNTPVTLVVGAGGIEDEYNGNDSLDYILNAPEEEDGEIIEGEAGSAPARQDNPAGFSTTKERKDLDVDNLKDKHSKLSR